MQKVAVLQSSRTCIEETSRPSTPLAKPPPPGFPQRARRAQKLDCNCDCKKNKTNELANTGDPRLSLSESSDETNELDSFEVAVSMRNSSHDTYYTYSKDVMKNVLKHRLVSFNLQNALFSLPFSFSKTCPKTKNKFY